ncbi:MAG: hypothetical protein CMP61_06420 [Flavobacteriales bacterium]|nr:hypothetical protein [Flavobacteriales bacterium]|tara:strand:+ start:2773 stop:4308 length:1536 start_codon:yes stop_codon:yes gene_type:complete
MKKTVFFLLIVVASFVRVHAQGHKIKFEIKDLNDSVVYLARYFGDNKYIKDTIAVNGKEKFSIEGKEELPCGIYMIVREKRNAYFEFLVSDQKFTVKSDTSDFINKTSFVNSPSNTLLYEYFKFRGEKWKLLQDSTLSMDQKRTIHQEINDYQKKFINDHPENPMSIVFLIQEDVDMPDSLVQLKSGDADKVKYHYYLNHYWDKVDLQSSCLLRTPVFHGKLQRYFDNVVPQHFDSIPKYADILVEKTRGNEEVFKYVVNYLTFKWESGKSKRMCWDKVFYHMARTYYLSLPESQTPWVEEGQMAKIRTRVDDLQHCLCNEKAKHLQMTYKGQDYGPAGLDDTLLNRIDFYDLPQDYIVLWFWDSDCGHCKKQTPKLWDVYQKFKGEGKSLEVYAINIEQETKGYMNYLRDKKYDWINVQDTAHLTRFRDYYDIYSTPVAFVLDKERKIVGKRIDPDAIGDLLEQIYSEEVPVGEESQEPVVEEKEPEVQEQPKESSSRKGRQKVKKLKKK